MPSSAQVNVTHYTHDSSGHAKVTRHERRAFLRFFWIAVALTHFNPARTLAALDREADLAEFETHGCSGEINAVPCAAFS